MTNQLPSSFLTSDQLLLECVANLDYPCTSHSMQCVGCLNGVRNSDTRGSPERIEVPWRERLPVSRVSLHRPTVDA